MNNLLTKDLEVNSLEIVSDINEEKYESDMRNFKLIIEYQNKKVEKEFQYDAKLDEVNYPEVMISVVGDMMADNLEEVLEELIK